LPARIERLPQTEGSLLANVGAYSSSGIRPTVISRV
jgi:hypothetical protein